ncbi:hypothetical protein ABDK00_016855 [Niabella insulamsoli]|uniref:hypothetical protein n=1 Tax=Niabella insulamsoli TaxID=3144874 RepID=UPI0031FE1A33
MARTKTEIKKQMTDLFIQNESVQLAYGLDVNKTFDQEFSAASIENILFEIFSFCGWWIESILDLFRADVIDYRTNQSPFTTRAIVRLAKGYLHGYTLDGETDKYDTSALTPEEIEAASIIMHASCSQALDGFGKPYLRLKMASETDGDLRQLTEGEMTGFTAYLDVVQPAGVKIVKESNVPDRIRMGWKIYYDPLIINATGDRIDGSATDVARAAIKEYLTQIVFNGTYAPQNHEVFVKQIEGISLCPIQYVQTKYALFEWVTVIDVATPDAGYYRFLDDSDLVIEYISFNEV